MSGFINLLPPPIPLGAMAPNDADGAWGIDCTENMTRRDGTISSVGTPVVTRQDGVAIGGGDLTISGAVVVASPTDMYPDGVLVVVQPGYGFVFNATTHGNVAIYDIEFPLTLSNGDTISRWATIPVIARPG